MESDITKKEGMILEIQRMSTEDGPGIRTTVFLKGCSLKCTWCHNPESISPAPQLQWIGTNCLGCRICVDACPEKALSQHHGEICIDRVKCLPCEICTKECPSGTLELMGSTWKEQGLLEEILKDRAYFEKSSGGITISGGEPAQQASFVSSLLKSLKSQGIHTAFDTCGVCSESSLKEILPFVDLVLFDVKEIDPVKHRAFTGASNSVILNNLKLIDGNIKSNTHPKSLWIRTPIIPDATDTKENIAGIARFLTENEIDFERWELCSFNNLSTEKYRRLGVQWEFRNHSLLQKETMDQLLETAKNHSTHPERIKWTGSVRAESNEPASDQIIAQTVTY